MGRKMIELRFMVSLLANLQSKGRNIYADYSFQDTCDEIRRKINAVLKKPGVTQAALLRAFAASFHKGEAKKISASQLSAFRSKKGPYAGNQSSVFYGAYVYFEKVRLAQKKPKSKKRLEMEEYHGPRGGVVTDHQMERFICRADERICVDSLGRFHQYGRELE